MALARANPRVRSAPLAHTIQDDEMQLRRVPPRQGGWTGRLQDVLESARFQQAITALIVVNAIALGLETSRTAMEHVGGALKALDRLHSPTEEQLKTICVDESSNPQNE